MSQWLAPLRQSLAECAAPVRWFFRDDDAGWEDPRLLALVDVFRAAGGHVDLAAIPAVTSPALGRRLSRLIDEGCVSVHQHGWAHVNHELRGRKCEFGPSRAAAAQRRDIVDGRDVLGERLDGRLEPIFTPPWNRCTDSTAGVLLELGFRALSAGCSARRRGRPGLIEIPVSLDWTRSWSRGGCRVLAEDLHDLARRLPGEPGPPVIGMMLHHAVMTVDELGALGEMLALLRVADAAVVTSIGALLRERTFTPVSSTGHEHRAR